MDDDEKKIKQSIKRSNFESVFGIEGDEGDISSHLRRSKAFSSKQSNSAIRRSIAGKFFLKRSDTQAERPQTADSSASDKSKSAQPFLN